MGVTFGGDKAYKIFQRGELVAAFHWVNKEPAMVLFPRRRRLGGSAFVIPLSVAHAYANSDGYPTAEAVVRCANAARVMAMEQQKDTIHNILTLVLDLLPELIGMPPSPRELEPKAQVNGEVELFAGGRKVLGAEVGVSKNGPEIIIPGGRLH